MNPDYTQPDNQTIGVMPCCGERLVNPPEHLATCRHYRGRHLTEGQVMINMWVIYDHPSDYPDWFFARRFRVGDREINPTGEIRYEKDLETLRERFAKDGMTCITRHETDDPVIVETWI